MCCIWKRKLPIPKTVALFILVCFIIVLLLSEVHIVYHAEHEHDHNGISGACTVCVQFYSAENLLKQIGMAVAVIPFGFISLLVAIVILSSLSSIVDLYTPIQLKTRMNN